MLKKYFKISLAAGLAVLFFVSCKKTKEVSSITDEGKTLVKLMSGGPADHTAGQTLTGINFVNTSQTIELAELRREPNSSDALNTSMKVNVQFDTVLLKRVNDSMVAHGGIPFLQMPASWYTLSTGGVLGNTISIDMAPGEISKIIKLTVPNAQLFDPARSYAFPLKITAVANGDAKISANNALIAVVGAKNEYDGLYELTFSNYHPSSNPGYSGDKVTVQLITSALNKVKIYWDFAGGYANPAVLGGSLGYFGSQEPEYTINTVNNLVTVQNSYSGATTFYTMSPSFNSYYDPAAKKIFAKWGYSYVGGTFAPGVSREWTQEFRYIGPR